MFLPKSKTHHPPRHRPPNSGHQQPKHPFLPSILLQAPDRRGRRLGGHAQGRGSDPGQRQRKESRDLWIFQTTRGSSRSGRRCERGTAETRSGGTSSLEEEEDEKREDTRRGCGGTWRRRKEGVAEKEKRETWRKWIKKEKKETRILTKKGVYGR